MLCPICGSNKVIRYLSLGRQPLANALIADTNDSVTVPRYELSLELCKNCLYVWVETKVEPEELFSDNTYLTGISSQTIVDMREFANFCISTCNLTTHSKVLDIASNDGTLLTFFKTRGMEVLGIDPSKPAYEIAMKRGVQTINNFFTMETSEKILEKYGKMDLITGTNIVTHVSKPIDFLLACKRVLKSSGSIVLEFYNFESLINNTAFDQIYHEHISYFNLTSFSNIVQMAGLKIYKVHTVDSQGGSLRVFISNTASIEDNSVKKIFKKEGGKEDILKRYLDFPLKVLKKKEEILEFFRKNVDKSIIGYGASAKATVLLNFLDINANIIPAIADSNPIKIGKFIPGTGIKVVAPNKIIEYNPNIVIIFSWNIKHEIMQFLKKILNQKVITVTFIPNLELVQLLQVNNQ